MIRAVIFDMDGLLVDSEPYWEKARHAYCASIGCDWTHEDELTVKGHNSEEWAAAIQRRCGMRGSRDDIAAGTIERMEELYSRHLPLLPGAVSTVRKLSKTYRLGLASSSPPSLIDFVLRKAGMRDCFEAIVSADDAGRGKPAPDVFLMTADRLKVPAEDVVVFEDSSSGIRAGRSAGMPVIAVPNPHYPPSPEALDEATLVLGSLLDLQPGTLSSLTTHGT